MPAPALTVTNKRRLPLQRLSRQAATRPARGGAVEVSEPVDFSKWFVCPTVTPLYYTRIYRELSEPQARRYSQLMGMLNNELICFFEMAFAGSVLTTLSGARHRSVSPELIDCLRSFLEDETRHTAMFRRLNRLSAPQWYAAKDHHIMAVPRALERSLAFFTRRPLQFPMVLWIMMTMEERSLMLSRRYAEMPAGRVEPHYAAVYRAHLEDEVRHVQIDWHLLERFYARCTAGLRQVNAALFRLFIEGFFLTPARANIRVVRLLADEFPELRPLLPRMERELRALGGDADFRAMMYSNATTPITFGLFEHFPEFAWMRRLVYGNGAGRWDRSSS